MLNIEKYIGAVLKTRWLFFLLSPFSMVLSLKFISNWCFLVGLFPFISAFATIQQYQCAKNPFIESDEYMNYVSDTKIKLNNLWTLFGIDQFYGSRSLSLHKCGNGISAIVSSVYTISRTHKMVLFLSSGVLVSFFLLLLSLLEKRIQHLTTRILNQLKHGFATQLRYDDAQEA